MSEDIDLLDAEYRKRLDGAIYATEMKEGDGWLNVHAHSHLVVMQKVARSLRAENERLTQAVAREQDAVETLNDSVDRCEARIAELEAENERLRQERDTARNEALHAKRLYTMARGGSEEDCAKAITQEGSVVISAAEFERLRDADHIAWAMLNAYNRYSFGWFDVNADDSTKRYKLTVHYAHYGISYSWEPGSALDSEARAIIDAARKEAEQ